MLDFLDKTNTQLSAEDKDCIHTMRSSVDMMRSIVVSFFDCHFVGLPSYFGCPDFVFHVLLFLASASCVLLPSTLFASFSLVWETWLAWIAPYMCLFFFKSVRLYSFFLLSGRTMLLTCRKSKQPVFSLSASHLIWQIWSEVLWKLKDQAQVQR